MFFIAGKKKTKKCEKKIFCLLLVFLFFCVISKLKKNNKIFAILVYNTRNPYFYIFSIFLFQIKSTTDYKKHIVQRSIDFRKTRMTNILLYLLSNSLESLIFRYFQSSSFQTCFKIKSTTFVTAKTAGIFG
jgi:hypothetical protein